MVEDLCSDSGMIWIILNNKVKCRKIEMIVRKLNKMVERDLERYSL